MANPDYLGFFLDKLLGLLKLCLECEEFPKYLENSCENVADFAPLPVVLPDIPIFWGCSTTVF